MIARIFNGPVHAERTTKVTKVKILKLDIMKVSILIFISTHCNRPMNAKNGMCP